jgi:hypothetical protein
MIYRKTKTVNGIDYYRIELNGGDQDPEFDKLPEHWKRACWDLESEDKKSNLNWPDSFYSKEAITKDRNLRMKTDNRRLVNGIHIRWDNDNDEHYITWNGQPLEAAE